MEIADRRVATLHFTLFDDAGSTLTSTHGHAPLVHLQGAGGIIPALEQALEGRKAGERFEVTVTPDRGFGPHHPELVQVLPSSAFTGSQAPVVGGRLQAQTERGPLEVEVVDVRLPTPDEVQYGIKPA